MLGLEIVLIGILASIAYGLSGYLKSMKEEGFSPEKFFKTVIIGIIVGAYAAYSNMNISDAYGFIMASGAIAYIENILKFIYRHAK